MKARVSAMVAWGKKILITINEIHYNIVSPQQ